MIDKKKEAEINRLISGWRAKGINIASKFPGHVGDAVKALIDTCAEELEEIIKGEK
jgi:hypothetical protein